MKTVGKKSAPPSGACPWLVYYHGKGYKDQTFCSNISQSQSVQIYCKKIPALHHKKVLSCSYGWLVLYDDDKNTFSLCNSSNLDTTIDLPSLDLSRGNKIESCILSSSPNSIDCKVLLFLKKIPSIMHCGLRDEEWSELRYGNQLNALDPRKGEGTPPMQTTLYFRKPVVCRGKIYAELSGRGRELWSIVIVEEPVVGLVLSRITTSPDWNHPHSCCNNTYLVESCGDLFSIQFTKGGIRHSETLVVEVSRLNFDTMVWERIESIRDRSFFVCSAGYCLSCPSSGPGYIYFTMHQDQSLYCYNIEDESVLVSLPCPNLPAPWLTPIWIMPQVLTRPKDCSEYNKKGQTETGALDLQETSQEDLGKNGSSSDEEKQLYDLPFDVLQEIIQHLKLVDYMNFRAVGRIFQSVAPAINWRLALSGSETSLSFPLLMICDKGQSLHKFVDPKLNQNYLMRFPTILEDTTVRYSNHGWLLMSRQNAVHLYNPFTRDIISYTNANQLEESFFFASKPSSSGCLLVSVSFLCRTEVIVSILLPGESEWTYDELQNKRGFVSTHTSPVFFQDAFYYLDQNGNLGKMEVDEESLSWEVLDHPLRPCNAFHHNFLVECCGELLSIFIGRLGKWVLIYKLNQAKGAWESVTSLSNYALYLSRSSCFSIVASPGAENRIYFTGFHGCGIVFYSLDTGKWHFPGSQDPSSDLYGSKLQLNSCWIKPSWF